MSDMYSVRKHKEFGILLNWGMMYCRIISRSCLEDRCSSVWETLNGPVLPFDLLRSAFFLRIHRTIDDQVLSHYPHVFLSTFHFFHVWKLSESFDWQYTYIYFFCSSVTFSWWALGGWFAVRYCCGLGIILVLICFSATKPMHCTALPWLTQPTIMNGLRDFGPRSVPLLPGAFWFSRAFHQAIRCSDRYLLGRYGRHRR